jgi:holo-[acyl-carrier protein] synthase
VILGIGVDVVDIERFRLQLERTPALVERLFVPSERALPMRSLAARFAAKEAIAKALGAPVGMNWQHCTIEVDDAGAPGVVVTGTVAEAAAARGVETWHLSLSHDGGLATAMVVAEGRNAHGQE